MAIQVQTLYKGVSSDTPASLLTRQFISFSFQPLTEESAKNIEDFNFVVVSSDDKGLNKDLFAQVTDVTKTYTGINGQQWYSTTYNANSLEFKLGTDGVDETELTDFINWFQPGRQGYLILSEHCNRKILARVTNAPNMEMTPFEKAIEITIAGETFSTYTTEYKGFITLNFTMDYPFWSAVNSYYQLSDIADLSAADKKLVYKTIYEDRIPVLTQFEPMDGESVKVGGKGGFYTSRVYDNVAVVGIGKAGVARVGRSGYDIFEDAQSIDLGTNDCFYLYYAGTAPAYPTINFTITIDSNSFTGNYITKVMNDYTVKKFSTINLGNETLKYTLPGFLACFNNAVKTMLNKVSGSYEDLIEDIKENVTDGYLCPKVVKIINDNRDDDTVFTSTKAKADIAALKTLISTDYAFSIDCKTGACTVTFTINGTKVTENCGDMLLSSCVKITQRSKLLSDGFIDKDSLIKATTSVALKDFSIIYDYMYL